jgi:hypothetical protein
MEASELMVSGLMPDQAERMRSLERIATVMHLAGPGTATGGSAEGPDGVGP